MKSSIRLKHFLIEVCVGEPSPLAAAKLIDDAEIESAYAIPKPFVSVVESRFSSNSPHDVLNWLLINAIAASLLQLTPPVLFVVDEDDDDDDEEDEDEVDGEMR